MNSRVQQDPEGLPSGGTVRAAGGLFEGFLRDALVNGAVFLSLIVVVAGFLTKVPSWTIVGLAVGVPGIVLPWLAVGKRWPIPRVWMTLLGVYVVDLAALTLMWFAT
jgi:hypothetical protein